MLEPGYSLIPPAVFLSLRRRKDPFIEFIMFEMIGTEAIQLLSSR